MRKAITICFFLLIIPVATADFYKELLIGYEVDVMIRAFDSSEYYDTVARIYKKGDSVYTKMTKVYEFKKQ